MALFSESERNLMKEIGPNLNSRRTWHLNAKVLYCVRFVIVVSRTV